MQSGRNGLSHSAVSGRRRAQEEAPVRRRVRGRIRAELTRQPAQRPPPHRHGPDEGVHCAPCTVHCASIHRSFRTFSLKVTLGSASERKQTIFVSSWFSDFSRVIKNFSL